MRARDAAWRRHAGRDLQCGRAKLRDVASALLEGSKRRGRALVAKREQKMRGGRVTMRSAGRELTSAMHDARNRIASVVGMDARRLQEDVDIEPPLREQIPSGARKRSERSEEVTRRRALSFFVREIIGEPAQRHELGFVQPSDLAHIGTIVRHL